MTAGTATPTVTRMTWREEAGFSTPTLFGFDYVSPRKVGWDGEVEVNGARFEVSRLEGEQAWTADAAWHAISGFPLYSNGWGARYLRTKVLTDDLAISALDAAALAARP